MNNPKFFVTLWIWKIKANQLISGYFKITPRKNAFPGKRRKFFIIA